MFGFIKKRKDTADQTPDSQVEENPPVDGVSEKPEDNLPPVSQEDSAAPAATLEPEAPAAFEAPDAADASDELATPDAPEPAARGGFFSRLKQGLSRTRGNLTEGLGSLLGGRKTIDADLLDDIEMQLLTADLGIEATDRVIASLTAKVKRKQLNDGDALMAQLQVELRELLTPCTAPLEIPRETKPYVLLVVGVNGVGKTTTIGKLARRFQQENRKVMLAAGDTFRAAAVEQLQTWGERNQVPVIAQASGSDSASVIFDAYQAAKARGIDVLIADTAGRLHNKANLMQELEKIVRVLKKQDDQLPHEVMLVLDATTGQNALSQAKSFNDAVNVTGLCLTKLDGTAKGGMVFAIANAMQLPIRFIGIGEQAEDLRPFDASQFVSALFDEADKAQQ
ncbi:signal recognition particle-docking protein FtsY [Pseudohongiella acticola]|uniref:Signal recognition particle receptor FtsY n=1 Tax=Pseudohongiella acticola TaxID=1524254 RepID=A0A1E8CLM5_9GAMM|nr:signal recognition particle-docking protein FtsY [Pseudohongiella acticola]OFE13195.1 signal recognition particle-docking protein FtsY [Pseudohongiella acticola]